MPVIVALSHHDQRSVRGAALPRAAGDWLTSPAGHWRSACWSLWPTVGLAVCALIGFGLLTLALKHLEVGAARAVWTGIGAAGTAAIGMAVLGDPVSTIKMVSIGLILCGVIGLNLSGVTR
jgi:quaternary ammonium compound-resistance protein SugE